MMWHHLLHALQRIEYKLDLLLKQEAKMAIDLTRQTAAIAKNTDTVASAALAIKTIEDLLTAIPPSNDPVTQAALDQLTDTLEANNAALAAAVATTPQNPIPVPPVVVVPSAT